MFWVCFFMLCYFSDVPGAVLLYVPLALLCVPGAVICSGFSFAVFPVLVYVPEVFSMFQVCLSTARCLFLCSGFLFFSTFPLFLNVLGVFSLFRVSFFYVPGEYVYVPDE